MSFLLKVSILHAVSQSPVCTGILTEANLCYAVDGGCLKNFFQPLKRTLKKRFIVRRDVRWFELKLPEQQPICPLWLSCPSEGYLLFYYYLLLIYTGIIYLYSSNMLQFCLSSTFTSHTFCCELFCRPTSTCRTCNRVFLQSGIVTLHE